MKREKERERKKEKNEKCNLNEVSSQTNFPTNPFLLRYYAYAK